MLARWAPDKACLTWSLTPAPPRSPRTYPGVTVSCAPGGVDADAESALLPLHRDGDVGQLTAIAADRFPATEKEAELDGLHPGLSSK